MSLTEILKNTSERNITVSIAIEDLRQWHSELINEKLSQIEQKAAENAATDLLTPVEICEILGCSRSTLTRWAKSGYLLPVKIGGKPKYRRNDVQEIMGNRQN